MIRRILQTEFLMTDTQDSETNSTPSSTPMSDSTSTSSDSTSTSIERLRELIGFNTVSSSSNTAISDCVAEHLQSLRFDVQRSEYVDAHGVTKTNLIARRGGDDRAAVGGLAYFCHTDVVPADTWTGPGGDPFTAVIQDERIYGRGACDMKGSLVAMLSAIARVDANTDPNQQSSPLWVVCTADEELGFDGARHLVANDSQYRTLVKHQPVGIIGEPTGLSVVHAHKGITGFRIISRGRAAHSSTRDGINATIAMVPMLQTLLELFRRTENESRYRDERFDPPTLTWNFGVDGHGTAINVTPDRCDAWVSFRTMPGISGDDLIEIARQRADELDLEFHRYRGGSPVWVDPDSACVRTMCDLAEQATSETVCYGTDGGEFTELRQLVVCGPGDIQQAHTTDEWLAIDQLTRGIELYEKAIRHWCYHH
tara:strand:- start:1058210 stop:1059487 length:1278 start_codon:yes stop_codon:yes gene_type:complete